MEEDRPVRGCSFEQPVSADGTDAPDVGYRYILRAPARRGFFSRFPLTGRPVDLERICASSGRARNESSCAREACCSIRIGWPPRRPGMHEEIITVTAIGNPEQARDPPGPLASLAPCGEDTTLGPARNTPYATRPPASFFCFYLRRLARVHCWHSRHARAGCEPELRRCCPAAARGVAHVRPTWRKMRGEIWLGFSKGSAARIARAANDFDPNHSCCPAMDEAERRQRE